LGSMVMAKCWARTDHTSRPPATENRYQRPCTHRSNRDSKSRVVAQRFLRLSNLDPSLFDRVGRYEARLWRQAAQTIGSLDVLRRPPTTTARRSLRKPVMPFFSDSEHSRMR